MRDLILLHGALETTETMRPLSEKLSAHFNCHLFGFSGHANTGNMPEPFSIETFAEELDVYLAKKELENVTVVGHSMGGYVALSHVAHYDNSPITRIVCYGTKFDWSEPTVAQMLAHLHPENEALMEHLKKVFGDNANRLLASTAHMMSHLKRLDGLTPEELADIRIPVDLVLGEKDRVVTLDETNLTAAQLPHAQVHIVKESRHEMERADLDALMMLILGQ